MKLLTIIVNYRTPEMTLDAVTAALRELVRIDSDWKLTVVDNDSQDGSFAKLCEGVETQRAANARGWERVEVITSGYNGGYGAGNNLAIQGALNSDDPPDYLYVLNSDAFPEENSIQYLIDYLDLHPRVGIVGSYIHGEDGQPHTTAFRFPSIASEFESSIGLGLISRLLKNSIVPLGIPEHTIQVDWLAGASMMIRSRLIEEVGNFDEKFFLYFEETDLCRRARLAGWSTVYVRESSVMHIGSVTTGMKKWKQTPDYWFDSRRYYFLKNHGYAFFWMATLARVAGEGLWQVRRRLQGKEDTKLPGKIGQLIRHSIGSIGKKARV